MFLLHCILLVSVITVSYQELSKTTNIPDKQSLHPTSRAVTTDEIQDLKDKINQQNTNIAQQNTKIVQQNTEISQLNTKIANQNTKIAQQNAQIAQQNAQIAQQNTEISHQNTKIVLQNAKLAEQDIKILEQNIKLKDLERKVEEPENGQSPIWNNSTSKESGSVFTRWGRRDCPQNISQVVYSGIAGGSYFTHTGGAAEYVCLPPDPMWNVNKYYDGPLWGYMYGAEYERTPRPNLDYKVPCAVCRSSHLSTVIMIPARTDCYQGWQKAYNGELVSGWYNHAASSQYICLDENPQTNGTNKNQEGKLMYPVRAKCGSLPCPPYEDNTLLTCVVCLK